MHGHGGRLRGDGERPGSSGKPPCLYRACLRVCRKREKEPASVSILPRAFEEGRRRCPGGLAHKCGHGDVHTQIKGSGIPDRLPLRPVQAVQYRRYEADGSVPHRAGRRLQRLRRIDPYAFPVHCASGDQRQNESGKSVRGASRALRGDDPGTGYADYDLLFRQPSISSYQSGLPPKPEDRTPSLGAGRMHGRLGAAYRFTARRGFGSACGRRDAGGRHSLGFPLDRNLSGLRCRRFRCRSADRDGIRAASP